MCALTAVLWSKSVRYTDGDELQVYALRASSMDVRQHGVGTRGAIEGVLRPERRTKGPISRARSFCGHGGSNGSISSHSWSSMTQALLMPDPTRLITPC
jgi:hypothetical protein